MKRTLGQRTADWVTEASGGWPFILWTTLLLIAWVLLNSSNLLNFDPPPFLLLNWILTVVSTMQSPLIMMSNNRQNDYDRENVQQILAKLDDALKKLDELP